MRSLNLFNRLLRDSGACPEAQNGHDVVSFSIHLFFRSKFGHDVVSLNRSAWHPWVADRSA